MSQETGTIIEDLFQISNTHHNELEIVNKQELETTYELIAKKGDIVAWYDWKECWITEDDIHIPDRFVKDRYSEKAIKIQSKDFEGNIAVTISDHEVRLWVCKDGVNIFRFKAIGKVYQSDTDITIIPN